MRRGPFRYYRVLAVTLGFIHYIYPGRVLNLSHRQVLSAPRAAKHLHTVN